MLVLAAHQIQTGAAPLRTRAVSPAFFYTAAILAVQGPLGAATLMPWTLMALMVTVKVKQHDISNGTKQICISRNRIAVTP